MQAAANIVRPYKSAFRALLLTYEHLPRESQVAILKTAEEMDDDDARRTVRSIFSNPGPRNLSLLRDLYPTASIAANQEIMAILRTVRDPKLLHRVYDGWMWENSTVLFKRSMLAESTIASQRKAIDILLEIGTDEALSNVAKLVTYNVPEVRCAAASALSRMKWNPPDPVDRARIAVYSGKWRLVAKLGDAAIEPLSMVTWWENQWTSSQMANAIRALFAISSVSTILPLLRVFWSGDIVAHQLASKALFELGYSETADVLERRMRECSSRRAVLQKMDMDLLLFLCRFPRNLGGTFLTIREIVLARNDPRAVTVFAEDPEVLEGIPGIESEQALMRLLSSASFGTRSNAAHALNNRRWRPQRLIWHVRLALAALRVTQYAPSYEMHLKDLLDVIPNFSIDEILELPDEFLLPFEEYVTKELDDQSYHYRWVVIVSCKKMKAIASEFRQQRQRDFDFRFSITTSHGDRDYDQAVERLRQKPQDNKR